MRRIASALVLAAALAAPAPALGDPGDVLVRYRSSADAGDRADARRDADVRREAGLPVSGLEVVDPEPGVSAREAVTALEDERAVLYAEPDVPRRALVTPDDAFFDFQWGLENAGQRFDAADPPGTPDADIDATDAWEAVTGSPDVLVAVIDTGVLRGHPDLAPNVHVNPGEVAGNGLDDDGNGAVDDVSGADVTTRPASGDPTDRDGHGTHVAGTIGARGNDGAGVAGVAWSTALLPVKALGDDGSGSASDVIRAYAYAVRSGARIVNLSLGGGAESRAERDAIAAAPGVLFVAAAGNEGADNDAAGSFPCNHDLPNVVCVAASDRSDGLAGFSNFGARTVDLAAPGVDIASTYLEDDYAMLSGTSMATPHVAGAAALLLARAPSATVADLRQSLLGSVDPKPALAATTVTGGRLNVAAAVAALDVRVPVRRPAGSGPGEPAGGDTATTEPQPTAAPDSPAPTTTPPSPTSVPAMPTAVPDRGAPLLRVTPSPARALRTLLRRRAVRLRVRCSEGCATQVELRRGSRRLARGRMRRSTAGTSTVTLRISARRRTQLRRLSPARLTLRLLTADPAGNRRTVSRRVTLRR